MSYLYVLENSDNGKVKIGISSDPERRINAIKSQGGFKSEKNRIFGPFTDYRIVEKFIHRHFREYRNIGEWFKMNFDENIDEIENLTLKSHNQMIRGILNISERFAIEHIDKYGEYNYIVGAKNTLGINPFIFLQQNGLIKRADPLNEYADLKKGQSILKWVLNDEN